MEKNTDIISKIKTLLGLEQTEVNLAQMKLEDGLTIVESEKFEEGDNISIIAEDGKVAMPVGEYELEDGRMLVVKEEGIIDMVKGKEEKEEKEEVIEKEEEKEEYVEQEAETPKKVVETVTKEFHFEETEKLRKEIEELKLKIQPQEEDKKEEKEEVIELKEEERVEPIVHNPENKKEIEGFKFSQNRTQTTLDRVMNRLSK